MTNLEQCKSVLADLEKASGASPRLDRRISTVLGEWWLPNTDIPGPWTASLDATIALVERVLPGWAREVSLWGDLARASLWECDREGWHGSKSNKVTATSKTEPLALLTALFRALIAQMEKADG